MSVALQKALTLEEFLAMPDTKPASEFWDGEVRQKPMPMTKHSVIQSELLIALTAASQSKRKRLGLALPELRCTFAGRVIVPDISFVRLDRLPRDPDGRFANHFRAAPDLVVEIVSPEQSVYVLIEKLAWCMQNGVQLGWLIDPDTEEITVFRPNAKPELLERGERLEGGSLLPRFRVPVAEIFDCLRLKS